MIVEETKIPKKNIITEENKLQPEAGLPSTDKQIKVESKFRNQKKKKTLIYSIKDTMRKSDTKYVLKYNKRRAD